MDSERLGDRSMIFFAELVLIVIGLIAIGIGIIFNNVVTRKRVILNQKEWDEYCKGMTDDEKREVFFRGAKKTKQSIAGRITIILVGIKRKVE